MARFEYSSITPSGRLMTGSVEATSQEDAVSMLEDMQLTANDVSKAKEVVPKTAIGKSEFLLFNQQLASITKAGIPLERGLRELAGDVGSRKMRKLIKEIADELEAGTAIDEVIDKRQRYFPPLYGLILKAGVESGRLSEMLTSLNRHLEIESRTKRIVTEALCYPLFVLAIGAIIATFVFALVVPSFSTVLMDMSDGGAGLPGLTQLFLSSSDYIVPIWGVVGIVIAVLIGIYLLLSASAAGRRFKESLLLSTPIVGRLYRASVLSRTSHAMAVLISAKTDMPTCLRLGSGSGGSEKIKLECEILAKQIEQGNGLMEAGTFCRMIPKLFLYSMQLGSQRNELQDNLENMGQMYASQTRCLQSKLQALLMPAMIILAGSFIGLSILAMFLPLIKMMEVMM